MKLENILNLHNLKNGNKKFDNCSSIKADDFTISKGNDNKIEELNMIVTMVVTAI